MLSCSLSGWRVAVLHPPLDHKYLVCGDHDPRVFLSTVALPSVLSAVSLSRSLVNFDWFTLSHTVLQANVRLLAYDENYRTEFTTRGNSWTSKFSKFSAAKFRPPESPCEVLRAWTCLFRGVFWVGRAIQPHGVEGSKFRDILIRFFSTNWILY